MNDIILHNYYRSSASYRVRIALALKGIVYEYVAHHLRHGEHRGEAYLSINPQGLVPALVWSDGTMVAQSMAIIEFIEEMVPEPPLLPSDPQGRARVRMLAQMIACEVHPLNNLRVLKTLRERFKADDEAVAEWFGGWVHSTFEPLEAMLSSSDQTGTFCHGESPGMADIFLTAQMANNTRYGVDMTPYPTVRRIHEACLALPAFTEAAPMRQPDAE